MKMSNTVDRGADTKEPEEGEEVDRVGSTEELEVDRSASTQEKQFDHMRLIIHVHPTEDQTLLKGIPNEPKMYALGQSIIFGRGEGVSIFLNDRYASKNHLELTFQPTQQGLFKVKNIGRKLLINNSDITHGSEHYLRPGDIIQIGQLKFITEIVTSNVNSSYILEFKKGSRGPNQVEEPRHQPAYPVPPYSPPTNPYNFPGQVPIPNQVLQPYVQPSVPAYPGMAAALPIHVAAYPASFPVAMQPIFPAGGPHSDPMQQQHPLQGNARREAFLSGGRSASENDDSFNPKLSVEETQPPKLESLGESFGDRKSS